MCELKSLHKSIALKLVERPLFAGADYLGEACECLMVAVKTLFPTRNVNHILLFCVLSYYFYAKRTRLHTIKARSATISTDHAAPSLHGSEPIGHAVKSVFSYIDVYLLIYHRIIHSCQLFYHELILFVIDTFLCKFFFGVLFIRAPPNNNNLID